MIAPALAGTPLFVVLQVGIDPARRQHLVGIGAEHHIGHLIVNLAPTVRRVGRDDNHVTGRNIAAEAAGHNALYRGPRCNRHDVARRVDCAFLGRLVAEHRLDEDEAAELAVDLAYNLPKRAYRL